MKILLLNPPNENTVPEAPDDTGKGYLEADDYGHFPPLGALYVLSYAEQKYPNHQYFFIDSVGEKLNYEKLYQRINEIKPDVVGITSFTISLTDVVLSAKLVRKIVPNSHICLGGHHPTAFSYEATQLPEFDTIVVGEGEYSFSELIYSIENNLDYTGILGVYTKDSISSFIKQEFKDSRFLAHMAVAPAYVENVDDIPPPNRNYIKHINYNSIIGVSGKLATMISTRGCPYKCTFCDVPYKKYRQRNLDLVMEEIENCLALGYEEFHFYDDLFNANAKKIIAFCDALKKRNLNIVWDFRGRVNGVTKESLIKAKEVGLRQISFGIETGTDIGLQTLRKGTNIDQVLDCFQWCKELGIRTVANYMIGLPHEKSVNDIRESVDFLIKVNPDYALINVLSLYPHTEIYRQALAKGLAKSGEWERFSIDPINYKFRVEHWTEFVTEIELIKLQRESYKRFYFRPIYIWNSIKSTKSFHELKSKTHGVMKLLG